MHALKKELRMRLPLIKNHNIKSIYFGGGTPSLLGPENICSLLHRINADCEVTLEANPETLTNIKEFLKCGINRLSIGVQSFNDDDLSYLGRRHSANQAIKSIEMAAEAGFKDISIDLMYDLPHQTLDKWKKNLLIAASLPITHISIYNLTIEPKTTFYRQKELIKKLMPSSEISKKMYEMVVEICQKHNFYQYEISAFAKNKCYSNHNIGYWIGRPFLGFGPSAFSYFNKKRFRNCSNLSQYIQLLNENKDPTDFEEKLPKKLRLKELLAINLKLNDGVIISSFEKNHGLIEDETKQILVNLQKQKLLTYHDTKITLTDKGRLFYDSVATEII